MRRETEHGRDPRRRPRPAPVIAVGLIEKTLAEILTADAEQPDEFAAGRLYQMRLSESAVRGFRRMRYGADDVPGAAVIRRLFGDDGALAIDDADAQIQNPAVAQLHRPVRRRSVDANRLAPGAASVCGSQHPVSYKAISGLRGERGRVVAVVGVRLEARSGEPADEKGASCGLDDAGIAVVKGGIPYNFCRGPGLPVVAAAHQMRLTPGANMLCAVAGEHGQQFSRLAAGNSGPADIAAGLFANHPSPQGVYGLGQTALL